MNTSKRKRWPCMAVQQSEETFEQVQPNSSGIYHADRTKKKKTVTHEITRPRSDIEHARKKNPVSFSYCHCGNYDSSRIECCLT